eukprot:5135427-Pyramimonas_sp.AAC.1
MLSTLARLAPAPQFARACKASGQLSSVPRVFNSCTATLTKESEEAAVKAYVSVVSRPPPAV